MKRLIIVILLIVFCAAGCSDGRLSVIGMSEGTAAIYSNENLLSTTDLKGIVLSHAEGSGSARTLTLHYMHNGKEEFDTMDGVRHIDLTGYDDENGKEQTFTVSDYDGDGIFDIIVYREFWFPDLVVSHPDVHEWPTIYEYDIENGFVVASAKHKDYFNTYTKASKDQLSLYKEHMSDVALLAINRLIYAAERIADGSFAPESQNISKYYEDVYELTKDVKE